MCVCVSGWVSWRSTVCGEMSVSQYVTACDCMSVSERKVCGVKVVLMELDVVHNRQDISTERERRRARKKAVTTWPKMPPSFFWGGGATVHPYVKIISINGMKPSSSLG